MSGSADHGCRACVQSGGGGQHRVRHDSHDQDMLVVPCEISSHSIGSMEELASECLVNDNNMLRIRTVAIGERSACKHRHLQRIEIVRGDIHLICRNLPSRLLAVAEGDCIEQGTL